jgi:regulator of sirC expression with transglutaminase-like and TPR domain
MDPAARFAALVGPDTIDPPLDEAALCIAALVHPRLDVAYWQGRLDELAASCAEPSFDGVRVHLFQTECFRGNVDNYADPANSLLDDVLARRLGIPITLAVVMLEVARRVGVAAVGVGMPGHFLVGDPNRDDTFCDAFAGGELLDGSRCRAIFTRTFGPSAAFDRSMLEPVPARVILGRMLANLERSSLARDPIALSSMVTMHLSIEGLPVGERLALARRLANLGDLTRAAQELDALSGLVGDAPAARIKGEARGLRARLN